VTVTKPNPARRLAAPVLSQLQQDLLDAYQRDFPLSPTPYADLARRFGVSEEQVIQSLRELTESGVISRIGPVFRPKRLGVSTLAAMEVPPARLVEVAELVSSLPEVNHNYEREHRFNLWFVLTAEDDAHLQAALAEIETATGLAVMSLPMLAEFHIDLGFKLNHGR
jgi:DNA-binding Lrp family transcriptional regulator